jgi:hypothetical protein
MVLSGLVASWHTISDGHIFMAVYPNPRAIHLEDNLFEIQTEPDLVAATLSSCSIKSPWLGKKYDWENAKTHLLDFDYVAMKVHILAAIDEANFASTKFQLETSRHSLVKSQPHPHNRKKLKALDSKHSFYQIGFKNQNINANGHSVFIVNHKRDASFSMQVQVLIFRVPLISQVYSRHHHVRASLNELRIFPHPTKGIYLSELGNTIDRYYVNLGKEADAETKKRLSNGCKRQAGDYNKCLSMFFSDKEWNDFEKLWSEESTDEDDDDDDDDDDRKKTSEKNLGRFEGLPSGSDSRSESQSNRQANL